MGVGLCLCLLALLAWVYGTEKSVKFQEDKFTILQVTDLHMTSFLSYFTDARSTLDQIKWLASEYDAGLIVATGDIATAPSMGL
ncbi:hypothetical protein KIPB_012996, partial [Kipferlia bialata]|eukprot:g12996.t1